MASKKILEFPQERRPFKCHHGINGGGYAEYKELEVLDERKWVRSQKVKLAYDYLMRSKCYGKFQEFIVFDPRINDSERAKN